MSHPFVPIETADIQWIDQQQLDFRLGATERAEGVYKQYMTDGEQEGNNTENSSVKSIPRSNLYDDIYYSIDSGIEQCRYVFIEGNNLIHRWSTAPKDEPYQFTIGETGFGTGLNFLLTWKLWEQYAPDSAFLHFISCEKHPLTIDDLHRALSNWPELDSFKEQLIRQYPVLTPGNHHLFFAEGRVKLTLMLGDCLERFEQLLICGDAYLEQKVRTSCIDAWYLDGFAPKKNEQMWTKHLIQVIAMLSNLNTTFATYTAASSVKSALSESGFTVIKKKGFNAKRHMLTGYKGEVVSIRLKQRATPWHWNAHQPVKEKSVLILGGGLAGCFSAYSLAQRGWRVTLVEKEEGVAQAASANQRAVLFPKLSAFRSPLTEFMLASFLYAHRFYTNILNNHSIGELKGALVLPFNLKEKKAQENLYAWLALYPQLGQLVSKDKATALAGIKIAMDSLFIPYSGWIDSPALCQLLLDNERISVINNVDVQQLVYEEQQWHVNEHKASVLILANGYQINQFKETKHVPIKPIRGQMTFITATEETRQLAIPVCGEGHVIPAIEGVHHLGATYELGDDSNQIKRADDQINLAKLEQITPEVQWSNELVNHWSSVRATTPDYLPLVGPMPRAEQFLSAYAGLESNAKRWIDQEAPYYPNLYACAGFGSRGLTTIPLTAEWLAAQINGELSGAPRSLLHALSPARFLRRMITRSKNSSL